jgi:hypothetical protein
MLKIMELVARSFGTFLGREKSEEKDVSQRAQRKELQRSQRKGGSVEVRAGRREEQVPRIPHSGCFCRKCAEEVEKEGDSENAGTKSAQAYWKKGLREFFVWPSE